MKIIFKEKDECVETVKIECSPAEYLVLNQAMKKYVDNNKIHYTDQKIMKRMLEVEPIFEETKGSDKE